MSKNKRISDWANLNKYAEENKNLGYDENRILFMGDSITESWSRLCPAFFIEKPYVNRGIGGQTTPQMLIRFRSDVIHLKPKTVVLLAGINDIAENTGPSSLEMILDNIISMVELAKANAIHVILCSVLPANHFYWNPKIKPAEKVLTLNQMIENYANSNQIPFVDYHTSMKNSENGLREEFGPDGVHPNAEGYLIMRILLEKKLLP